MSDDEYYSDNNSLSEDSDNEDIHKKTTMVCLSRDSKLFVCE